jgi:hypothetical protein
MVLTGFNHVTRQGFVVAVAFLERADANSYTTFFKTLFKHNPTLIIVTSTDITFSFEALCVDFSDAQRKGLVNAVIAVVRCRGCHLSDQQIQTKVLLYLKGCESFLTCRLNRKIITESNVILILDVIDIKVPDSMKPLIYMNRKFNPTF